MKTWATYLFPEKVLLLLHVRKESVEVAKISRRLELVIQIVLDSRVHRDNGCKA